MMRLFTLLALSISLMACSDSPSETEALEEAVPDKEVVDLITDDRLVISSLDKVPEANACILPITISNGTDKPATISMMQFEVSGSGESDSGNMFGQTVAPGEINTARILFPSRQCEELLEINPKNLKCETNGLDCVETVEFESREGLAFASKNAE